jgi:mannose-6-phosphate isomerase-like protein (cupin superfamily)
MRKSLVALILTLAAVSAVRLLAGGTPAVTYIGHEKVAEALSKGGDLVKASDLIVLGSHRSGPGQVEVHEKETDVFYVVDGAATLITGGTMVGGKSAGAGQLRGTDIRGGEAHHLSKGDVMVIPAGIPHWFKEASPSISYYVVKVLKP